MPEKKTLIETTFSKLRKKKDRNIVRQFYSDLQTLCFKEKYFQKTLKNDFDFIHHFAWIYNFSIWQSFSRIIFSAEESKMVPLQRSDSLESTQSEREFRKKYQAITHRMVHRKSSAVMYSRILERTFGKNTTPAF